MSSHPAHFADVDSRLPPSLLRCGRHPLPQDLTPPRLPLHTPPSPSPRRLSYPLLLSVALRILRLELPTSLPRLHWLPRKHRRPSLGTERPPQHQVSFLLILPTCMQASISNLHNLIACLCWQLSESIQAHSCPLCKLRMTWGTYLKMMHQTAQLGHPVEVKCMQAPSSET